MGQPIRIAQIVGRWVGGGVEAVVWNYYQNIDRSLVQFDFICDSDSVDIPYELIESLGGRVILIPPYSRVFKYRKALIELLKKNKYTIVHSHINTLSVFPLSAARAAGVPVRIAHSHSTTNKLERKRNLIKNILRPFSKIYPTHFVCCSQLSGRWLFGDKVYDKGQVLLLNNAIDLERFAFDFRSRRQLRAELGIGEDTKVIGHVGRFVTQKNHIRLIDIFAEICRLEENCVLLLAGQGPLEGEIRAKASELGLSQKVHFLGRRSDVNRLYHAFDLLILPSLYEGLPVVGIEAQASGLPCLLSDEMTQETGVLETSRFLSLSQPDSLWAQAALDAINSHTRVDTREIMKERGYCIEHEAGKLCRFYLKLARKFEDK